ncbi:FAD/NAD(P)-binding domain-containing protein [Aspergillus sclerotiicarbonarius CBS 121057]|uniref:FAD/NAD(P)-binding domain-containing protein n=1 Tax=Aspergillus sclerotiicarbonarius (strain CBS 121057 / IBT 28362) TaxID=1448318 RepID=A0A319E1S3_ASPSB|nr:FAD/NAD(P)-binding domain-containing protein [Aspergillus sclerotiicarbonarius CBS 121057]
MAEPSGHYQVVIVGGGIAGLTLALAFERLGIRYALLEARESLEPDYGAGAGVGLQPNGLRILDQLGLLEEIEQHTLPLETWMSLDANGKLLSTSRTMSLYRSSIGYSIMFVERRKLLQILSSHLKGLGSIQTSTYVESIEETEEHATVLTSTGLSITADVVIGADGVRSRVRNYIDTMVHNNADDYMSAKLAAVYGMSSPTKGISPGDRFTVYREKATVVGFTGKDGVVFWFVFENLDQPFPLSKCPRYTATEADTLCQSVSDVQITPSVKFADLYTNRIVATKIAAEEGVAKTWHTHRTVIVGDAAHKMTPAGGMGANQAIESSAALVNEIMKAMTSSTNGTPSRETIHSALARYAEQRFRDSAPAVERSRMICEALFCSDGPAIPRLRQMLNLPDEEMLSHALKEFTRAPILDDLGLSARGMQYEEMATSLKEKAKAMAMAMVG